MEHCIIQLFLPGAEIPITTIVNAASEFHIYKTIWLHFKIMLMTNYFILLQMIISPFNKDFFLILNVAMGGTFGGAIDPPLLNLQWKLIM
jgi:hypothetical protein